MKHIEPISDSPKRTSAGASNAGPVAPQPQQPQTSSSKSVGYPNVELNPLVGVVSSLVYKYRNMPTSVPINSNVSDQYLDELKNTIYLLEQHLLCIFYPLKDIFA